MDEQVIDDLYNRAVSKGYKKSKDDFIQLLRSDNEVFNDMYSYVKENGYQKTTDDFSVLVGKQPELKKKEEPILPMAPQKEQVPSAIPGVQPFTGSPLEGTPSELPSPISEEQPIAPVTPSYVEPTPVQPEQGPLGAFNQKITGPDYGGQLTPEEQARAVKIQQPIPPAKEETPKEEKQGYFSQLIDQGILGVNQLDKMIASIPEAAYNILAIPQNFIAFATGLDISTSAEKFGKDFGIENPILKKLNEEQDALNKNINKFNAENYQKTGIYDNIKDGNYSDAFQLLGSSIVQSAPTSLAMMVGGATLSAAELTAAGTLAFSEGSREQLNETAPNMSEIEKTIKSLGMASAETVFSQVGTGTIGKVYKDIIKKEGLETGKVIFRNGLVEMYKTALKKYGAPIGLLGEGIEEVATQVTQNVISGKPAFEGAADAFIVGGGSGVVFATPITVMKAKDNIKNIVETNNSKSEIKTILKDKPSELHQVFNVPQAEPFTPEQIQIANTNKSRDILVKNLDKNVKDGVITSEDAKQSVYIFDKAQQVSNAVKDLDVSIEKKTEVANLLSKRNDLKTKIENKEDVLVVKEKQQIDQINKQISDIILEPKTKENAIQEQAADESVLRIEQPQVGLQEVVEGNVQPEVTTTGTEEVIAEQPKQEEVAVPEIKRESIRLLTDEEVNPLYDEIPMNLLPISDNVSKQDAVFDAYFKSKQNNTNPELIKVVESSLIKTPEVSSKTQEVAPAEITPVIEVEQYVPITEKEVRHEAFTRDNAIDYEEDYKTGENGREYPYISSLTVELTDNDGNSIGNLIKLVDEDGNMTFEAEDLDRNKLSKDEFGFDTKGEAKKALVDKWNKTQKKEFDKEAKNKVKEAEKTAAKEAKKTTKKQANETLQSERVQPKSGIVRPESKIAIKPTGLAIPSQPSSKREEVKKSIQEIANSGLLRSAETGKSTITEEEIDAQMALNDAMARVWKETTGKDNFYETFIEDIKQGDIDAIVKKGGALFQNVELPQLPITRVTLAVFDLPEFQKMNGISVAPQSISDLMKSRGKQIEKDIINTVLSYDKYKGQKRIPFDEFRDDVETQLMKLERINTTTYASYGKDNLGDNHTYGEAQTIIFNSPIDHGEYGHFRNDFFNNRLTPKTWEIRQVPNTEQYVAIDSEMPSGTPANEMSNYIGTAGPRVDVDKWINDRNSIANKEINKGLFGHIRNWFNKNTGVYTLAELQSDYYQKNKANDLYASRIPKDEVNEYVNKNFRKKLDNETTEAIKKEFGIFLKYDSDPEGNTIVSAFSKSNFSSFGKSNPDALLARNTYAPSYVPLAGFTLADVSENQTVIEALRSLANKYNNVSERRRKVIDEYEAKRLEIKKEENKYIAKRIEEIKKSESGNLMLSQFVASQKVHELRLFREALKHAADKGAEELWFPTPYTLAKIEGYVSSNGNAPYDIITGDESGLEPGDIIDYGGTKMTVVESSAFSITVAPSDEVSIYNIDDFRSDEVNNRMSELEYDLDHEVTNISSITKEEAEEYKGYDYLSKYIVTELKEYFQNNPEEETVSWDDIEDKVRNYVEDYYYGLGVQDLISWAADVYEEGDLVYAVESARRTERLSQPSEYESDTNEDDFEDNLSDDQLTVVKKYGELNQMIKKMRPDAEVITDGNDKKWIKTTITNADATNPIIAFQNEGGKIKGAIDFSNDNKASIYIFDGADISTLTHEMSGHLGRRVLEKLASIDEKFSKDYKIAQKWAGVKNNQWTLAAEEKWARGFERYLRSGKAPSAALTNVFKKLQNWLTNIYKSIKGSSIDIKLTDEITSVFDNLLATKKETTLLAEEQGIADELMNLDVNDEDSLKRILDALDRVDENISKKLFGGANESLLAIPLGTVQLVIKSLKVLVKGGMLLRDAIRKVATDNNISQESIKDILNIAPIQEGFNSVMSKVDAMIERQKQRGVEEKRIISNVDTLVRNEEVYKNADDAQKKILEREARVKLGVAPRRAPSIGRVLGVIKDITNISRQEKLQVIKQIRELSRDAAKDLANEIKELAKTGTITPNQAANIIARFGKVNMLNEVSVSNFVDYMSKVFENAEYVNKIEQVNSKLKTAKKNIGTKIGTADGLILPLQRLFSINPTLIPQQFFDRYSELVNMFGEKQAVLSLEEKSAVTKDVESILAGLDEEQSKANELADRFNQFEGKVFDDEGRLQYADTINKMVEEKVIDEDKAEIMRKYKSDIAPQVGKTKMTDEQISEEKKELIQALNKTQVDTNGLPTRYQRDLANRLKDLVSTKNVEELSNADLKNLLKVLDNINNNYLPHYAQLMVEKLNSINDAEISTSAVKKAVIAPLSGLYSKIKSSVLGSKRTAVSEMVRRNPLFYIDQIFGNFKTKDIFNAVFNKVSEAEAKFKADLKRVQNILEKAEERVAKSFNLNGNDTLMSKFKMMTYMVQLEYDSNQGSKQVNPAADYLRATIKHIDEGKSQFGERDANMLQKILKEFAPNGEIDNDKLYNSFNKAEKSAIKDIRGVNESLREKAEDTAAIIRGDRINPLTNYVHLNVLHEHQPNDLTSGVAFVNDYNNSMRGSTKAKSLIERTGKVSPLNFDIFASAQRGAKFVLMDYNLTEPIRTARKTIKQTISNFEKEGRIPKEKRQIINAIDSAFEEATENVLTNTFVTNSLADDFVDYVNKQGYRAVLAGTSRFVSELSSNIAFAVILDPKAFATGVENKGFIMSVDAPLVMENVNSKQTNRIFPTDTLSGKVIDTNILQQTSGIKGAKSKNPVANKTQQIWNLSGKKVANTVELTADALISTPDKLAMRPMWFGSFANEFKNISGEKVDFNKIAANDEKYMEQHKEAIEKAKTTADEKSIMMGATDNPFMGILKGTVKPDQKFLTRAFNNFNNFMTKFMIFEYVSARTGIMAAMGNGSLTKKQGVAVLGAVTTRMVVYTLMLQMLGTGLMGLIFGDGEEPEDEKSFMQKLGQAFASAFTSIALGRDFGNATKQMINIGVERVNENYLDFLREGDYDPYKDAIQYSIVPPDKEGKQTDIKDFLLNMGGAFGPALKTADLIGRKLLEPEKKEADAIERREDEIKVRIPLEILGNLGFIPLYKDIRKVVLKNMYRDLENAERTAADKKKAEKEKLHGYKNKSDMERYDPELWDKVYGPNSPDYDKEEAIKEIKKAKQKLEREMKDEMYDYTPKSKSGFGSSKFGQGASKSSFGSAKFGQ